LLTQKQREWIDLQKMIKRAMPAKRPRIKPTGSIRSWCFDRATQKHGWSSRAMTILIFLHVFVLMYVVFTSCLSFTNRDVAQDANLWHPSHHVHAQE
jgi:hypothetical protein